MFSKILIGLVRGYQLVFSPHIGTCCRFTPTCSVYAIESIRAHGPWRGLVLGARRLLRCHPFGPRGLDPVPSAPLHKKPANHAATPHPQPVNFS